MRRGRPIAEKRRKPTVLTAVLGAVAVSLWIAAAALGAPPPPELEEPTALSPQQFVTPETPRSSFGTHSIPATGTGYDLDFTLPTAAKGGCGVCHADSGLVRLVDEEIVSFFVDPAVTDASAHAGVQCTGCHVGFASTAPHEPSSAGWEVEAKTVCRNCHRDQFIDYGRGAHRQDPGRADESTSQVEAGGASVNPASADPASADPAPAEPGETPPLCGDCHGSHDISPLLDDKEGQREIHSRGWETCGRCHQDYWDSYDDYYHGAAYKRGALDAPACWDCHGWHEVLPASDPNSTVSERHLGQTCSRCHSDFNDAFLEYASLIHGREEVTDEVFLYSVIDRTRDFFGGLLDSVLGR